MQREGIYRTFRRAGTSDPVMRRAAGSMHLMWRQEAGTAGGHREGLEECCLNYPRVVKSALFLWPQRAEYKELKNQRRKEHKGLYHK